jgi:hypothetical protein
MGARRHRSLAASRGGRGATGIVCERNAHR